MSLLNIFLASILTQNIVLTKFLGMCSFFGTSNKEKKAVGMGLAVMFVVIIASIITYTIYHFILVPTKTEYLQTIMFILIIACCVQIASIIIKKFFHTLHESLGIYLPLITTNCAVLGITLLNIANNYTFIEMLVFSIGSSLGFTLVIYIFSTIREHLEHAPIPRCFKGEPIAFIIAAIMTLIFSRFNV